jgi:Domain of unknown function (DUF4156)
MSHKTLIALALTSLLCACTWVKVNNGGEHVRVSYDGNVSGCRDVGNLTVSVKDRVGPYQRNDIKVRDELESLARNEAATMQADTIKPLDQPKDGEQRFAAYACGASEPQTAAKKAKGETQTYPVR